MVVAISSDAINLFSVKWCSSFVSHIVTNEGLNDDEPKLEGKIPVVNPTD